MNACHNVLVLRVLVTGFEPFGAETYNASAEAVRLIGELGVPGVKLATAILPVAFDAAPDRLGELIAHHQPDLVMCVGEAGGRLSITPERWAVNEATARIPDNVGAQPQGGLLGPGPQRLASRLDVDALVAALRRAGLTADPSSDAGRYVCNATFWAALTLFDGPAGFVHVPALRPWGKPTIGLETDDGYQAKASGMTINDLARGLGILIATAALR